MLQYVPLFMTESKAGLVFFVATKKRILRICSENPNISILHFNDATVAAFSIYHGGYNHLLRTGFSGYCRAG
jgi:hypothetical protein